MNRGNELTVWKARELAATGGIAYCNLDQFDPGDESYAGLVTFEPVGDSLSCFYIVPVSKPAAALRIAGEDIDVSVVLTDIDLDDYVDDPRETVYEEWDDGTLTLYEVI